MLVAEILAGLAAAFGAFLGFLSLIRPKWGQGVVRLVPDPAKPGGFSEFRSSYGGLFLGFNGAVLLALIAGNGVMGASFAAGLAWLGSAVGRVVSMALDGTDTPYNRMNVAIEGGLGLMLLAPFITHIVL